MRFKHQLHNHLGDSVRNGRNSQRSSLTRVAFWNLDEAHRRREVTAGRHSIPELVEIPLQVFLEVHQRLTVHTGRSAIRLDLLVRVPNDLFRNRIRLCLCHELLLRSWFTSLAEQSGPFAPRPLQTLQRYYRPVRPCASHRYSGPCGATTWTAPLTSRRQVPRLRTRA